MAIGNTVAGATAAGILYQHARGSITDNTLYNNAAGGQHTGQVVLTGDGTEVTTLSGNTLYGLEPNARTLWTGTAMLQSSDDNRFLHPRREAHIHLDTDLSLAAWQSQSGLDAHSGEIWFSLGPTEPTRSILLYNDSAEDKTVALGESYVDLDQSPVGSTVTLPPYGSLILVRQ